LLFVGAVSWYRKRTEWGWRFVVTGSDLGLLFGLGVVTSGPIWGSAEWGVPWDWGDLRLNTYGLLTAVALFLVLSRRTQPDGEDTRDTLAAVGLFGFALVPITALATTWYQNRHPGLVVIESEESGLDPQILMVLMLGFASFLVLFAGLVALSDAIQSLKEELEDRQRMLDEEAIA
jgi:heme exporter protein C